MVGDPPAHAFDVGFEVVRRGYDQEQVDEHLLRLDAEIRIIASDRDAAVDQSAQLARELEGTRARAERLRAQVRVLARPPQSVQGMSERMRSMLRLAEDEVAEMLGRAEAEVNGRLRDTDERAAQIVAAAQAQSRAMGAAADADAERASREHDRARAEIAAERTDGERRLAAAMAEAAQERSRALAESESRRALVEEDFTLAMNQRRSDSLVALTAERLQARREVEELRESAAAWARQQIAQAEEHARRTIADAERRVGELTALRGRVVEQLGSARAVLGRALTGLAPLADEEPQPAVKAPTAPVHGRGVLLEVEPAAARAIGPSPAPTDGGPSHAPDDASAAPPADATAVHPAPGPEPDHQSRSPSSASAGRR